METPPLRDPNSPGLHIALKAAALGSLGIGSPIYYRNIAVGEIEGYKFMKEKESVSIQMHIAEEYTQLIRKNTRFYNVSGITVDAGLSGVKIQTESLTSLMVGGVAFITPESIEPAGPSKNGDVFKLYKDYESATESGAVPLSGVPISITFNTGNGLKTGHTLIKYKGMTVGKVKNVVLNNNLNGVSVEALLDESARDLAREGSKFWLVKPRLELGAVSGLDTLISGQYITVRPGKGKPVKKFVGLESPPLEDPNSPGLHIILTSIELGSLQPGSPIYYRKLRVGEIKSHELSTDHHHVRIHAHILDDYTHLVKENTRFWDVSGITVTGGLSGIKIRTESLTAVLDGGIAFETPDGTGDPSENGMIFKLYPDRESAMEKESGIPITISFSTSVGLKIDTPVKFKGITIGQVTKIDVNDTLDRVVLSVLLIPEAAPAAVEDSKFWVVSPKIGLGGVTGLDTLLSGSYIDIIPGHGKPQYTFEGLDESPLIKDDTPRLHIALKSDRLGSLKEGVAIYYREIKVGQIEGHELAETADRVIIHASIEEKYAPLVRKNSVFWNASGIGVDIGLGGVEIQTESLEAVLAGGVAFATPEKKMGAPVADGHTFEIHDKLDERWLKWAPRIPLELSSISN